MEKGTESNYSTNYWVIFGNYPLFIQRRHEGFIQHVLRNVPRYQISVINNVFFIFLCAISPQHIGSTSSPNLPIFCM